jgi:hypothetical protein
MAGTALLSASVLFAMAPAPPAVLGMLRSDATPKIFAGVVNRSNVQSGDFGGKYVTFIVPADETCDANQTGKMQALNGPGAQDFIRDHAVVGQFVVIAEGGHVKRVDYFPAYGAFGHESVHDGQQIWVQLLSGRETTVALVDGKVQFGAQATLLDDLVYNVPDGGMLHLGQCGVF